MFAQFCIVWSNHTIHGHRHMALLPPTTCQIIHKVLDTKLDRKREQIFKGRCLSGLQRQVPYDTNCVAVSPLWVDWPLYVGLPYLNRENL